MYITVVFRRAGLKDKFDRLRKLVFSTTHIYSFYFTLNVMRPVGLGVTERHRRLITTRFKWLIIYYSIKYNKTKCSA